MGVHRGATRVQMAGFSLQPRTVLQHQHPSLRGKRAAVRFAATERGHDFKLSEYMVVLDKPLGLSLGLNVVQGNQEIVVQSMKEGSPAATSQLIQVGDIVRKCSAVFGEDMWHATDIRRMRWAINNRTSKVKLVLERVKRPLLTAPVWYTKGQVGMASVERDTLQLPVSFFTNSQEDDWSQDLVSPGRPMFVGFHRSTMGGAQQHARQQASIAARHARLQHLREELVQAATTPVLDLSAQGLRSMDRHAAGLTATMAARVASSSSSSSSNSSSNNSNSNNSKPTGTSGQPDKRVCAFLPWLLITSSRMDTRDLTTLASLRGLGSMLELSLGLNPSGQLAVRGAEGMLPPEMSLRSLMMPEATSNSSGTSGICGSSAQVPTNGSVAYPVQQQLQQQAGMNGADSPINNEVMMLLHAAACMQRLAFRRMGSFHHSCKERCAVLLHCEPGSAEKMGTLLAGWLHWYWHMPLQEAMLSAELATGSTVKQELVDAGTEQLVRWAEERLNQAVVTWKYGALSVSVAGDIVGGWSNRVPLVRCINPHGCKGSTSRGHFFLPLTGLRPGVYYYKFIVDGTWTVDPSAPKVIDTSGNYNNWLEIHARPPCITTKEKQQLARLQAAQLALETKMVPSTH